MLASSTREDEKSGLESEAGTAVGLALPPAPRFFDPHGRTQMPYLMSTVQVSSMQGEIEGTVASEHTKAEAQQLVHCSYDPHPARFAASPQAVPKAFTTRFQRKALTAGRYSPARTLGDPLRESLL